MKILHLFSIKDSIYSTSFMQFIEENFDYSAHEFAILGVDSGKTNRRKAASVYYNLSDVKAYLKLADKINKSRITIVHGIFLDSKLSLIFNLRVKKGKLLWMIWGGDLYTWKSKNQTFLAALSNWNQKFLREKMYGAIISFSPDERICNKEFVKINRMFYAHYPIGYTTQQLEKNRAEKTDKKIHILVGNSANRVLNHKSVLDSLKSIKNEEIQIHLPLNYGDIRYADEIEEYAKDLFGKKAICYREKMDIEDYIRLLWHIDIGIFDTERQIALGNIIMLCYMGKKIFLKTDSVLYEYFIYHGIKVGKTEEISAIEFAEMQKVYYKEKERELALEYLETERIKKQWDRIFSFFS